MPDVTRMKELTNGLTTKSEKIRVLSEHGFSRADIARFLGIRYQHVRNVLVQAPAKRPPGLEEAGAPPISGSPGSVVPQGIRHRMSLKVDAGGRVLIPSAVRETMGVGEGDTLLAWLEEGELHLVSPQVALRQAQALARKLMRGEARSLADELIAQRREEARREAANG